MPPSGLQTPGKTGIFDKA